jgi:hypothetical protein
MSSSNPQQTAHVQKDWEEREFVEVVSVHILQITEFLNTFDSTVRQRMARLNEQLERLERGVEYVEARMDSAK